MATKILTQDINDNFKKYDIQTVEVKPNDVICFIFLRI